jgi:uncharacterized membrane protein
VAPTLLFQDRYRLLPFDRTLPVVLVALAVIAVILFLEQRARGVPWGMLLLLPLLLTFLNVYTLNSILTLVLSDSSELRGVNLLGATATAWCGNTVCFALWYYTIDQEMSADGSRELAFPDGEGKSGRHNFFDYLYVAAATGVAFSATDTAPLTTRLRLLMLANGLSAFILVAFAAARALNAL